MDLVTQYVQKKQQRLEAIGAEAASLREQLEALSQEEAKVRTQIETAQDMARELGEVALSKAPKKPSRPSRKAPKVSRQSGVTLVEAIRHVTRDLPEFTTGEVRARLQEGYPDMVGRLHYSSIAGTMRRMADKDFEQIEKGGPGKEARYRHLTGAAEKKPQPASGMDDQATFEGERELVESAR